MYNWFLSCVKLVSILDKKTMRVEYRLLKVIFTPIFRYSSEAVKHVEHQYYYRRKTSGYWKFFSGKITPFPREKNGWTLYLY